MRHTTDLLSPKGIAQRIHVTVPELRTLRRKGLFPPPDARVGQRFGWSVERVDRYAGEDQGEMMRHVSMRHGPFAPNSEPSWWSIDTIRYIGLAELAEAAALSPAAVWSHYYNRKLPDPDITIGHRNRIAGWTPAHAKDLAVVQGWRLDLARLDDTSDLGKHL